nr:acetate--CoA ligase family protein [Pseudomonas sp.]
MSTKQSNSRAECVDMLRDARAASRPSLTEPEAKRLLSAWDITTPAGQVLTDATSESLSRLEPLAFPLVVKVVSSEVLHKSDSGGVVLNLPDQPAVAQAIAQIQGRHEGIPVSGYLVEEMAPPGVELVIGGNVDAS